MTKPFTGTQAELADELTKKAIGLRRIAASSWNEPRWAGLASQWEAAAALVRNAIITEPKQ